MLKEVTSGMSESIDSGHTNTGVIAFKWITAAVGAVLLLVSSFIMTQAVAKIGGQDQMIQAIKIQLAGMEKEMTHMEQLVRAVSELTLKAQGLDAKTDRVEMSTRNSVENMDERLKIITERLLAISQRLDGLTK